MKDASRSAATRLAIALRKVEKKGDPEALQALIISSMYRTAFAELRAANDRHMVLRAQTAAMAACFKNAAIPARLSMRVRWTPERVAELRQLARKHGADFEALALHMAIPVENARRAYHRYVKVGVATAA